MFVETNMPKHSVYGILTYIYHTLVSGIANTLERSRSHQERKIGAELFLLQGIFVVFKKVYFHIPSGKHT